MITLRFPLSTLSMGLIPFAAPVSPAMADQALYDAKKSGRNQISYALSDKPALITARIARSPHADASAISAGLPRQITRFRAVLNNLLVVYH